MMVKVDFEVSDTTNKSFEGADIVCLNSLVSFCIPHKSSDSQNKLLENIIINTV